MAVLAICWILSCPFVIADNRTKMMDIKDTLVQSGQNTGKIPLSPYVWKVLGLDNEKPLYIDDTNLVGLKYIQEKAADGTMVWDLDLVTRDTQTLQITSEKRLVNGTDPSHVFHELEYLVAPIFIGANHILHSSYSDPTIYLMNLTTLRKDWSLTLNETFYSLETLNNIGNYPNTQYGHTIKLITYVLEDPVNGSGYFNGLYSINALSGKIEWHRDFQSVIPFNDWGVGNYRLINNVLIFTTSTMSAFSIENGSFLWTIDFTDIWDGWSGWRENDTRIGAYGYSINEFEMSRDILMISLTHQFSGESDLTLPPPALIAVNSKTGDRLWVRYLDEPTDGAIDIPDSTLGGLANPGMYTWNDGVCVLVKEISISPDVLNNSGWGEIMMGHHIVHRFIRAFSSQNGNDIWKDAYGASFVPSDTPFGPDAVRWPLIRNNTLIFVDIEPPAGHIDDGPCFTYPAYPIYLCPDHDQDRIEGTYSIHALNLGNGSTIWEYYVPKANPEIWGIYHGDLFVKIGKSLFVFKEGPGPGLDLFIQPLDSYTISNEFQLTPPIEYYYYIDTFSVSFYDNGYGRTPYTTTIEIYNGDPGLGGRLVAQKKVTLDPDGGHVIQLKPFKSGKGLFPMVKDNITWLQYPSSKDLFLRLSGTEPTEIDQGNNNFTGLVMIPYREYVPDESQSNSLFSIITHFAAKNYIPLTSGIIIFGSIMAVGITEEARFNFLRWAAIPCYTRLKKKKILENKVRFTIYGIILARPGINLGQIKRMMQKGNFVMAYHLQVLEREGYIFSKRFGTKHIFYPVGKKVKDLNGHRNEIERKVLKILEVDGRASVSEICNQLKVDRPLLNYHIRNLKLDGFVKTEVVDGTKYVLFSVNKKNN